MAAEQEVVGWSSGYVNWLETRLRRARRWYVQVEFAPQPKAFDAQMQNPCIPISFRSYTELARLFRKEDSGVVAKWIRTHRPSALDPPRSRGEMFKNGAEQSDAVSPDVFRNRSDTTFWAIRDLRRQMPTRSQQNERLRLRTVRLMRCLVVGPTPWRSEHGLHALLHVVG